MKKYGNVRIIIYTNIMMSPDEVEAILTRKVRESLFKKTPKRFGDVSVQTRAICKLTQDNWGGGDADTLRETHTSRIPPATTFAYLVLKL